MVDIYLDGLKPRIKAQWDKLGKKPKKKEIKLANAEEIEEELKGSGKEKENEGEKKEGGKEKGEGKEDNKGVTQNEQIQGNDVESPKAEKKIDVRILVDTIMSAHKDVGEGNITNAKNKYKKIMEMYKIVPKELKKEVFNECITLQKELKGK